MFKYLLTFAFGLFLHTAVAQSTKETTKIAAENTAEIKIKTSAQCDMCKKRIEKKLSFEKGIKSAVLDVDSKVLTIVYKKDKTDEKTLKTAVSKIGYDADGMVADKGAYDKLPECCQKGGH
jgi:mercuric ion binding protein